ncbi:efflux RND transporter periplasmic adaptor subunit [Pedobacter sp. MC2016-15]|uniref:efflux RND transporter periplasmic adaptor subunit n=1 Tax=Pedobacter sp. MC2016-15 TaxID=2994473 RepID=UPI0022465731|nr:efflux RND transporter periplasmic adaptor subunit [Pedobacter sp. MC2016-15]MCX2477972.1 efflux RND transporter periplasmic adaptor subunit [Pedobacter sp. MC2016-15]
MKLKLLVILILAAAFQSCSPGNTKTESNDVSAFPVIKLGKKDTSLAFNYVADIQSLQNVEIRSRVHGFIDKILVDEGQQVKKGQLLFQMNDKEYQIALSKSKSNLASARSSLEIAEVELERIKTLVQKKVISVSELTLGNARLTEAKAKVSEALAMVDEANQKLSYVSVRAPFDGVIDRLPFKTGSLVSEGALLTTVADNHQMYAYFDISENEYLQFTRSEKGRFSQNKETTLILSDGTVYSLKGKIQTHESSFSDHTGSIAFRAIFENPKGILKHGASGKVQLLSRLDNSLLVPQKSVFEIQDKNYVFLLGKNNRVKMKSFVPKLRIAEYYVVDSGLNAGDQIVYEGVQSIKDGAEIKPVDPKNKNLIAKK